MSKRSTDFTHHYINYVILAAAIEDAKADLKLGGHLPQARRSAIARGDGYQPGEEEHYGTCSECRGYVSHMKTLLGRR